MKEASDVTGRGKASPWPPTARPAASLPLAAGRAIQEG